MNYFECRHKTINYNNIKEFIYKIERYPDKTKKLEEQKKRTNVIPSIE